MASRRSNWLAAVAVWLLPLVLVGGQAVSAVAAAVDEVAVMRRLRAGLLASQPGWANVLRGWSLEDTSHPCTWQRVVCDEQQHITTIKIMSKVRDSIDGASSAARNGSTAAGPLIAELAQLPWLEELHFSQLSPIPGNIPPEWGLPGAFPSLKVLVLSFTVTGSGLPSLPSILPGALPQLRSLQISANLQSTLPVSWGSLPSVLPSLAELKLDVDVVGQLPVEWANGFQELRRLLIYAPPNARRTGSAAPANPRTLPPEWARGFPKLNHLALVRLGLVGTIPAAWDQVGSFPALNSLDLDYNELSGTLPADIFRTHPMLESLGLARNHFMGTLPEAWGSSAANANTINLSQNALTGRAFPSTWTVPGAMARLITLGLANNSGLHGVLPDNLPWPRLSHLKLQATGMHGSIPASWCSAPFVVSKSLSTLNISLTAVSRILPACAKQNDTDTLAMSTATAVRYKDNPYTVGLDLMQRDFAQNDAAGPATVGRYWLLAALCGLVAAGATGRVLWHRRLRQRWGTAQHQGLDSPAGTRAGQHPLQDSAAFSWDSEMGGSSAAARVGPSGPARQRKRAALAALLSAQIRDTRSRVQLLPLPALFSRAMHHLNQPSHGLAEEWPGNEADSQDPVTNASAQQYCASSSAGSAHHVDSCVAQDWSSSPPGSLPPVPRTAAREAYWQADQTAPLLFANTSPPGTARFSDWSAAWGYSTLSSPRSTRSASGDDAAAALVASRKWGLPTHSLHVSIAELEFPSDKDGQPVELDAGAHAAVYLGRLRGADVAVKVFELQPHLESGGIWREAMMLRQCMHERIVPLYGVALQGQLLMLAMPLMRGGSLRSAIRCPAAREELCWEARGRQVAVDVADALAFLHGSLGIMHGDLKTGNVLLTEDFRASLSDLGLAQVLGNSARTVSGFSRYYAAPEQLMGQQCTIAADMYSFGILLVELTTRELGARRGDWRLPNAPQECPQSVLSLIQACLAPNPAHRPTAAQALPVLVGAPE